jgi:hypothetical protein
LKIKKLIERRDFEINQTEEINQHKKDYLENIDFNLSDVDEEQRKELIELEKAIE